MTGVRVLVGTRKGAFILMSDGKRERWDVAGPFFGGWEIYHLKGSPAEPNRIYASQSSGWFGQLIQRSDDGGLTWTPVGNKFVYDGVPGTHQWYDGTAHPWEFKRVWHLEPSLSDPDTVYAGVEDAALFRSTDAGQTWNELSGLRKHGSGPRWQPGAGGMCLHTIILDRTNPERIFIAISAAGAFRTDDGGTTWQPINRGLRSEHIPDPTAEVGHCVHHVAMHQSRPGVLFMQKIPGMKSAGTCRPTSDSSLTFTRTNRTRSMSFRSRATRSIIRSMASYRSIAVVQVAMIGNRSRAVCLSATATSTCCGMRWPLTHSIHAEFISVRREARCTPRPMQEIHGTRSFTIFHQWSRSRSRLCHDSRRPAAASENSRKGRQRGGVGT